MNQHNINVKELADRYEENPDSVLPEITEAIDDLNFQNTDNPSKEQSQKASRLIMECSKRRPAHFRNNFAKHATKKEAEWFGSIEL